MTTRLYAWLVWCFAVFLALVYWPALALAGDGSQPTDDPLVKLLMGVVAATVAAVGERVWSWLSHKKAAQVVQRHVDVHMLLQSIVADAIDYADEQAHKALKYGKEVLTSTAKKHKALTLALDMARARGLDKIAEAEIEKIIEARLGAQRRYTSAKAIA